MKSVKGLICNGITLLVSVLALVFFGQAFYAIKGLGNMSGYDFLELLDADGGTARLTAIVIGILLAVIIVSLIIVATIIDALRNAGVLKNETLGKVMRWVNLALWILLACATIIYFVSLIVEVAEANTEAVKVGWAAILNFVFMLVTVASMVYAYRAEKNQK